MRSRLLLVLALAVLPGLLFAREAREDQRINYLLDSLNELPGAVFIRNGHEYNAAAARAHLLAKLHYGGERIQTAEQFIKGCATESSMSHQPYRIRFGDGHETAAAAYFYGKLREFDARPGH